jgi:hypothetical protein
MAGAGFRFPGGDSRTICVGATGSGKTTCAMWLLAHQRFDKRPWVILDLKREPIFDQVGFPPIEEIAISARPPRRRGLYLTAPLAGQDEAVDAFLWRVFHRGNLGLYIDELALAPGEKGSALHAILQQGRSKRIPVIGCAQRPVNVARPIWSEASFFCIYRLSDRRDYKVVEGFIPSDLSRPQPRHYWRWYDVAENRLLAMRPVPPPVEVAAELRQAVPAPQSWHPFGWTSRPTGRPLLKVVGG